MIIKFKEWLIEGVGDIYADKKFNIKPDFHDFEETYLSQLNKGEVIYNDHNGNIIIKNPNSLENIGEGVRAILDKSGNLYVEQFSKNTHEQMLLKLSSYVKYVKDWYKKIPTEFICLQRDEDTNWFLLSEGYYVMIPEEDRDESYGDWSHIPDYKSSKNEFEKFLNKAKSRFTFIKFFNEKIYKSET
jgi:hypothetical protein